MPRYFASLNFFWQNSLTRLLYYIFYYQIYIYFLCGNILMFLSLKFICYPMNTFIFLGSHYSSTFFTTKCRWLYYIFIIYFIKHFNHISWYIFFYPTFCTYIQNILLLNLFFFYFCFVFCSLFIFYFLNISCHINNPHLYI